MDHQKGPKPATTEKKSKSPFTFLKPAEKKKTKADDLIDIVKQMKTKHDQIKHDMPMTALSPESYPDSYPDLDSQD